MRRLATMLAVVGGLAGAGEARAEPLGWALQPLPGWTCEQPSGDAQRCTTHVAVGDVGVACEQYFAASSMFTDDETSCAVTSAGAPVAECRDTRNFESFGTSTSTRGCTASDARVACDGTSTYQHDTGGRSDEEVCGVTLGDLAVRCVRREPGPSGVPDVSCGVSRP